MATASGDDYSVADITLCTALNRAPVATYAAAVREGGEALGAVIGVLGIHFDWEPQARAVVRGVRLSQDERARTRVMLVDARNRVIAASDQSAMLEESFVLDTQGREARAWRDREGNVVAFHRTPGYETYRGLGWCGVIVQAPRQKS